MSRFLLLLCCLIIFAGLSCNALSSNEELEQKVKVVRVDKLLKKSCLGKDIQIERDSNRVFFNLFEEYIIGVNLSDTSETKKFCNFPTISFLLDTVDVMYSNLIFLENELTEAKSKWYKMGLIGDFPVFYSFVSGFQNQIVTFELSDSSDGIGIGLDMFLGGNFPYKKIDPSNSNFSDYLSKYFGRENISVKALFAWLEYKLPQVKNDKMIDHLIKNGKIYFILCQLLSDKDKSLIFEFSREEMDWVVQNEREIWTYLLENGLLYSNNVLEYIKLISHSPNVNNLPEIAPGGLANYIGYHIVSDFMIKNNLKYIDLINNLDAQFILDNSNYKP